MTPKEITATSSEPRDAKAPLLSDMDETEQSQYILEALADTLPEEEIFWRIGSTNNAKTKALYVPYIEATFLRRLLDQLLPGSWDLHITPIPGTQGGDEPFAVKAAITIDLPDGRTITREDIGTGKDWKQASTDAFKRAAVRYGVAHSLYEMPQVWVDLAGGRPVETAAQALARTLNPRTLPPEKRPAPVAREAAAYVAAPVMPTVAAGSVLPEDRPCPKCAGPMWDNRATKRNPKQPDFKCRDRGCDGVIWPPRPGRAAAPAEPEEFVDMVKQVEQEQNEDLPF